MLLNNSLHPRIIKGSSGFGSQAARIFLAFLLLIMIHLWRPATARANSFNVTITIISTTPARVRVQGETGAATKAWSFSGARVSSGGQVGRVSNLSLADAEGAALRVRELAPGEFESDRAATRFTYDLKLDPPLVTSDAAHLSWLSGERGIIFLGDALPVLPVRGRVTFKLPAGWEIYSTEPKDKQGVYELTDVGRALFILGRDLRVRSNRAEAMDVSYVTAGEWAFPDEEILETSKETLDEYRKMMGAAPQRRSLIALLPFPMPVAGHIWSAETRGGTALLLSGRLPSKTAALAQLNGALTHELFHLWVPNGLALEGEYSWFYEGFTLYQALRAGMRQGRLTFQDYLNAMGRAYDGYKSARGQKELSLIEASERRWTSSPALVYHKGMLVAFLYDLTLMSRTEGKSSLDDVYRELYRRHALGNTKAEAAQAVVSALSRMKDMKAFTENYIQTPAPIDLDQELEAFGLQLAPGGISAHVVVANAINRRQGDLLKRLGYNERRESDGRGRSRQTSGHQISRPR